MLYKTFVSIIIIIIIIGLYNYYIVTLFFYIDYYFEFLLFKNINKFISL